MELELGGREDGPLEVTSEAGGSWKGAPAADNLLGGLASKSLPQRRGGVGQKNGQPERKKTVLVFDDFPNLLNAPVYQFWHLTFLKLCSRVFQKRHFEKK